MSVGLSRRRCCALLAALAAAPPVAAADPSLFARNFDGLGLVDQDNRAFGFERLAGKVLLVNFVFTGCSTVCPVQTHVLAEVQRGLPGDIREGVHFVSVSLDPLSDTPPALKAYARRMGADLRHWSFVTGRPADIERVADRLRLFRPGPDARKQDDHTTALWLVDARGRLMQRLHGNPPDGRRLGSELTALRRL